MSKRSALLVAIVAAIVLAAFFFWPQRASADVALSARIGGGFGGYDTGARLHRGDRGLRGRVSIGTSGERGAVRGRLHLGGRDFRRHPSFQRDRAHRRHGSLLGDRFRLSQHRRIGGSKLGKAGLIGDRFRFEQKRRLNEEVLEGSGRRDWRGRPGHGRPWPGRRWHGHNRPGHVWHGRSGVRDGRFLGRDRLLLPYGGAGVIIREVIVPVLVPAPAERSAEASPSPRPLEPRGRAELVSEGNRIVGDRTPGDALPRGVPHVALDPVAYGLPQPPPGQIYARVGADVLRIAVRGRRIVEVLGR